MTWSTQCSRETTATAQAVWDRWTSADAWAQDDPDVRWAALELPVRPGSTGKVKSGGPAQVITFAEVVPLERMTFRITLPGAVLSFPHRMAPGRAPGTLHVTHEVRITGPLASVFGVLVGRGLARGLPAVLRRVTENAVLADV